MLLILERLFHFSIKILICDRYLKNKVMPDEKRRLHFFNSFFFRKLADPEKDPPDASKGGVAYQRVKKWTRKVNLFEKDYVFIPVNYK